MAMFPAFFDTCTLYGAYLCDSLLRLAEAGTYRPLWSADVLNELERALVARGLEKKAVTHRIRIGMPGRPGPDWSPTITHLICSRLSSAARGGHRHRQGSGDVPGGGAGLGEYAHQPVTSLPAACRRRA
jgi:hypothetical protein